MHRTLHVGSFFSFILGLTAAACSSSGGSAPACSEYVSTADLKAAVSFKQDVLPILDRSCAFASCHGGNSGSLKMAKGDAAATRGALVGVAAPQLPSMKLVEPGDPKASYLMKKMDGDVCLLKGQCQDVGGTCSDTMPQGNDLLEVAMRDTVRRWIAQGAPDN